MAIYRKGDDLTPLQTAATEQKQARKDAGTDARAEAGLGGSGQRGGKPRLGNLRLETSTGKAYSRDYQSSQTGPDGKKPKVYHNDVQISGGAVAAHTEKRIRLGRQEAPEKKENTRKGVGGGVIEKGEVKKLSWKGKNYAAPKASPKKKAAGIKDTREALKGGHITAEEAAGLNKKLMTPSVKKKK